MSQTLTKELILVGENEKETLHTLELKIHELTGDSVKIKWSLKTHSEVLVYSGKMYTSVSENMFASVVREILANVDTLSREVDNFEKWDGNISSLV